MRKPRRYFNTRPSSLNQTPGRLPRAGAGRRGAGARGGEGPGGREGGPAGGEGRWRGLDRRDAVPAAGERAIFAPRGGEPADQVGPQALRLDDVVHDQLAGQPEYVDVGLISVAQFA